MQVLYKLPIVVGRDLIRYRSVEISSGDDVSLMFNCHTQFQEIHVMELFIVVQDFPGSSGGSVSIYCLSLPEHSPTFAMASLVQNENV